ncbi:flagellar hook-length control protein FliK [Bacillus sp. SCS-153A]|uniref:flagellar hook-length control protein FliK n=1 Tax=Rossellomorea sedimentorum TaxID=3115294 RepID=UPI0039065A67
MNVGTLFSMQNVGQLSGKGQTKTPQEGKSTMLFNSFLSQAGQVEEKTENLEIEMLQLLNMLNILQSDKPIEVNGDNLSTLKINDILSEVGITQQEFNAALQSILDGLGNQFPHLKEMFLQLDKENQEEILFQVIETIGVLHMDDFKKLSSPSMEILLKTTKAFQHVFRQTDLNIRQTEMAEALQQNLKVIAQKVEQLLTGETLKNEKRVRMLEKAFHDNLHSKQPDNSIPNNRMVNKNAVNSMSALTAASNKFTGVLDIRGIQSTGEQSAKLEGEQTPKNNGTLSLQGFVGQQQMPRIEQFSLFVNKGQQGTTYEQFVKDFSNIIGKSQMIQTPNMSKLLLKLYPEQLGSLRIELLQHDGVMTAKILASTKAAKEILDSQLTGLRQALNSHNLQVEKIEIAQTFTESHRQERQPSQQQNGQQQKEQSNQESNNKEEPETTFKELLMNSEV